MAKRVHILSRSTVSLQAALKKTFGAHIAGDLAFNCAEIYEELPVLQRMLDRIMDGTKINARDLDELQTMLTIHWPYHLGEIKRIFRKFDRRKTREPDEAGKQSASPTVQKNARG